MNPLTRVLFDLDGTLTDPSVGITRCLRHALHGLDLQAPTLAILERYIGPPLDATFLDLGVAPGLVPQAIELYRERFSSIGLYENVVYPGIPAMLTTLSTAGLELYVATSKPTVFATRILQHFELAPHFSEIVGATLDGTRSLKADVIAHAVRVHGTQNAVMIGDRKHDLQGAAAHAMLSIGVTWGFGSPEELAAEQPWHIVTSVMQLTELLITHTS